MSVSMTMNGAVLPVLAMYIVAAEEQVYICVYVCMYLFFFSYVNISVRIFFPYTICLIFLFVYAFAFVCFCVCLRCAGRVSGETVGYYSERHSQRVHGSKHVYLPSGVLHEDHWRYFCLHI